MLKYLLIGLSLILLSGCPDSGDDDNGILPGDNDDAAINLAIQEKIDAEKKKMLKGEVPVATQPSPTKPTVTTPSSGRSATYTSYGVRNGGRQAWRIPKKGTDFGPSLTVVFSNGYTVRVNNTSKNFRQSNGFVFKPGIGPNGTGDANTGTAHGGVYIHAPYNNRSKLLTIYY